MTLSNYQKQLLNLLKRVALEIGDEGRCLTDLIGELSACEILGLVWKPTQGFDAIGTGQKRYQIKTRKSWSTENVNPSGRMGRFGKKDKYEFDQGLYVELDKTFTVKKIWQLPRESIMELEVTKTKSKGLHVGEFTRFGKEVYPKSRNH